MLLPEPEEVGGKQIRREQGKRRLARGEAVLTGDLTLPPGAVVLFHFMPPTSPFNFLLAFPVAWQPYLYPHPDLILGLPSVVGFRQEVLETEELPDLQQMVLCW